MSLHAAAGSVTLAGVALPARWATHPVVAAENVRPGWDATHLWFDDDALLVRLRWRERTDGWGRDPRHSQHTLAVEVDDAGGSVLAVGSADGAARLILAAGAALAPVSRTSVPRGTHAAVHDLARRTGRSAPPPFDGAPRGAWDWFGTTSAPPPRRGEDRVVELVGDAGRAEVAACLAVANPDGELHVDEPRARWWGWRDDAPAPGSGRRGVLRGVVGASRRIPGQPWVLGSIGTDPAWRGRGIAAAVTAVAVRAGLAEVPTVTLGVYADNAAARRLYAGLGFAVGQEFESWRP